MQLRQIFWAIFFITFIIKLLFASLLPINSDEAYFVVWGSHLDYGYYDHPPMVGWWLWLMLQISDALLWLRLPVVLVVSLIGWLIYRLLSEKGESVSVFAAAIYLLLPVNLAGMFITTDTPLILWMFLSIISFYFAIDKEKTHLFLLAGLFLGLAVLSKYFSALLGFAYLVYFLVFARTKAGFKHLLLIYLASLPFILLNLYWNYNHCWVNYLFNFVNRHGVEADEVTTGSAIIYWLMWLWVIPPLLYFAVKNRLQWPVVIKNNPVFVSLLFVPVLLFALLSFVKLIGLHWLLGFVPVAVIVMAALLSEQQLRRSAIFLAVYSFLHIILLSVFLSSPFKFLPAENQHIKKAVLFFNSEQASDAIKKYQGKYRLSTLTYSNSSVLSYYLRENVSVIGPGAFYARQDDLNTDYRQWADQNVLILTHIKGWLERYEALFAEHSYETIRVNGHEFYLLLGNKFNYQMYHKEYLSDTLKYYQIPDSLPVGECYFYDKYFPAGKSSGKN